MSTYHHRKFPPHSTLLSGREPPADGVGFTSRKLQIWLNNTTEEWEDERAHAHTECDEAFIVMKGRIVVDVEGEEVRIGPREFCCFPAGVFHQVVKVYPPVESFAIRAPSVEDKIYR